MDDFEIGVEKFIKQAGLNESQAEAVRDGIANADPEQFAVGLQQWVEKQGNHLGAALAGAGHAIGHRLAEDGKTLAWAGGQVGEKVGKRVDKGVGPGVVGGVIGGLTGASRIRRKQKENLEKQADPADGDGADSSYLGRYLGMQALQSQARIERPIRSGLLGAGFGGVGGGLNAVAPGAGSAVSALVGGPITNRVAIGKDSGSQDRMQVMIDAAHKRKGHFGQSFGHGAKKWIVPSLLGAGLAAGLGGAIGGSGGDPKGALYGGIAGGVGGLGLGLLSGGGANALNDTILARTSPETNARVKGHLSRNPAVTGLPLGSVIGAGMAKESEVASAVRSHFDKYASAKNLSPEATELLWEAVCDNLEKQAVDLSSLQSILHNPQIMAPAVGALGGAGIGALAAPEGERLKGAAIGAGLGGLGGYGYNKLTAPQAPIAQAGAAAEVPSNPLTVMREL